MEEVLEFAKQKRTFEGTPKMIMNQTIKLLDEIAFLSKQALSKLEEEKGSE